MKAIIYPAPSRAFMEWSRRLREKHRLAWYVAAPFLVVFAVLAMAVGFSLWRLGFIGNAILGWVGIDTFDIG